MRLKGLEAESEGIGSHNPFLSLIPFGLPSKLTLHDRSTSQILTPRPSLAIPAINRIQKLRGLMLGNTKKMCEGISYITFDAVPPPLSKLIPVLLSQLSGSIVCFFIPETQNDKQFSFLFPAIENQLVCFSCSFFQMLWLGVTHIMCHENCACLAFKLYAIQRVNRRICICYCNRCYSICPIYKVFNLLVKVPFSFQLTKCFRGLLAIK